MSTATNNRKGKKKQPNTKHRLKHPEDRNPYRYVWISLLLFFLAIFILISELSYFENWKADASIAPLPIGSKFNDTVMNSCGHIGAKTADVLVRELFGFAAVFIPYTVLLIAFSIAHLPGINPRRRIYPSVVVMCFVSMFLGVFFGRDTEVFGTGSGGEMGIYIAEWIKSYIGEEGTSVLMLVLLALLLWIFATRQMVWVGRKTISGITVISAKIASILKRHKEARLAAKALELPDISPVENSASDSIVEEPVQHENHTAEPVPEPTLGPVKEQLEEMVESPVPEKSNDIETISLNNGQFAAVITDDFTLNLDLDALDQMRQEGLFTYEEPESEEEEIFTIKRNSEPTVQEEAIIEDDVQTNEEDNIFTIKPGTNEEENLNTQKEEKVEDDVQIKEEDNTFTIKPGTNEEENPKTQEEASVAQINEGDNIFTIKSGAKEEEYSKTQEEGKNGTQVIIDDLIISKNEEEENVSDEDVNERALYDPTFELGKYNKPTIDLLNKYEEGEVQVSNEEIIKNKNQIVDTLATFGIKITEIEATVGPTVTLYEIKPAPGTRISKIQNLGKDIALALSALGIRIIAPIPGKGTIGIEVPNRNKSTVSMYSVIKSAKFHDSTAELPIALGKTIQNETLVLDLAKMPHLLVAGATGQGKSVGLNAIITSLLYKKHPAELKFVMVDPKRLELTPYSALANHFLAQMEGSESVILTDTDKVVFTLNSICKEMDDRYKLLEDAGVKNLKEYNNKFIHRKLNPEKGHRFLPYIVVVVDEFADLIMTAGKEIETPIARIAQLARAAGIHMIIATQRPTADIIRGTIRANFPARIAFRVTSSLNSSVILDKTGAEQLIGRGDMLVLNGNDLVRVQCAFVDTPEIEAITKFIGSQRGYPEPYQLPEYQPESENKDAGLLSGNLTKADPMLVEIARYVVDNQIGSTSKIQREFEIGFNRAGRIVDQLESLGIVGKQSGSKPRQVLISDIVYLEQILDTIRLHK